MMTRSSRSENIVVIGASEHNLQAIDITLPRDTLTVFTGVSGSGKSSLAFDTLYKEGQRRFLESLSPYARQFLGNMEKPRVEHVEGLSPTIAIDQKTVNRNPRSTVGTITELYDHFRLLFARLGQPHCPDCRVPISTLTAQQIADRLFAEFAVEGEEGPSCIVYAPMVRERKGEYRKELTQWLEQGFLRARIDGDLRRLDEPITLARYEKHTIELSLDRLRVNVRNRSRLAEAVERGLELTGGLVQVEIGDEAHLFSGNMACPHCQLSLPELEPRLFSFNDPQGACSTCNGLGMLQQFAENRLVRPEQSIAEGTFTCFTKRGNLVFTDIDLRYMVTLARHLGIKSNVPWARLPGQARRLLLEGNDGSKLRIRTVFRNPHLLLEKARTEGKWPGLYAVLRFIGRFVGSALERYQEVTVCPDCQGRRLSPIALAVTFRGKAIDQLASLAVEDTLSFFRGLELSDTERIIGKDIFREIQGRLSFLVDVGAGYLSLDRRAATLSGGEAQRIRLASQLGSGLQGVLYVLDEPSIGLHQTDNRKLIQTLQRLRDAGNTVFVVEHDLETIASADHVVDLGPGAGSEGGRVLAQGSLADLMANPESLSGRYLSGEMSIPVPATRRKAGKAVLFVQGASRHNLKNLSVKIPLGLFVAVTGVSGSGKSTLVHDILKTALAAHLAQRPLPEGDFRRIQGLEHLDKVIEIDQSPIGRTPRSNPATYTKVFDQIRALFAQVPEARMRGYKPGRFSFNVKGGRCEACEGAGVRTVEMQFLSNVEVTCEECEGRRFNEETLQIRYKGRTIQQVLEMSVVETSAFFSNIPGIAHILNTLVEVGLGYIRLGQPSTTLSGGEAQRVKLASELRKRATGRTLYLLDEPTTGLHFHDIRNLLECLSTLVEQGNTVLVIEHNLDVIKVADHVIDLGPGGGKYGGELVCAGTPEEVAAFPDSLTGQALKSALAPTPFPAGNGSSLPERNGRRDLRVRGAEKNNLKRIDVTIPHGSLTVLTGVSGSGKTSLAFDTIFAEGQARYVESLSTYARRFLGRMDKARVDGIEGLAPAIAIDQKNSGRSPRSTVATITEIYDYLRLLYARIGAPHCPRCGEPLQGYTPTRLTRELLAARPGERLIVMAPLFRPRSSRPTRLDRTEHFPELARGLVAEGFARARLGGQMVELAEWLALPPSRQKLPKGTEVELVIDRLRITSKERKRVAEACETAFAEGRGLALLVFPDAAGAARGSTKGAPPPNGFQSGAEALVSEPVGCVACDFFMEEELTPRMFSFNSHVGACEACSGLGTTTSLDPALLVRQPHLPLLEGALEGGPLDGLPGWLGGRAAGRIRRFAWRRGISLEQPFDRLGEEERALLLYGETPDPNGSAPKRRGRRPHRAGFQGVIGLALKRQGTPAGSSLAAALEGIMGEVPCPACRGERLKAEYRAVTLGGRSISRFCELTVEEALGEPEQWRISRNERLVATQPLQEIRTRLGFLLDVGLGYLTLDREAVTLSGGEAQRIRLASQLGSHLVGVLYVLDEPTIGLHTRDVARMVETLRQLRERGNIVLVVEHDPETIRAADHIIDIGPGAGHRGGEVVVAGTLEAVMAHPASLTGGYLSGRLAVSLPEARRNRTLDGDWLHVRRARANNLKDITVGFPLRAFTAVTGVSGSGKSTLVVEILQKSLERAAGATVTPGAVEAIEGLELVTSLGVIDQSAIGKTPRSNPATYTGVMDRLRQLFAEMPEAKVRGYKPGRFSFNVPGGRCEACEGKGLIFIEMHFLADVWLPCEVCGAKRYNRETLQVFFRGKTIADILDMEIADSLELLAHQPRLRRPLQTLVDVGLGYMKLGQPANSLSGGEAQRVKLAAELGRSRKGQVLYLLDEPTVGLHPDDIAKLLVVLHRLVDEGATVIIIEHNLDVIQTADYVVDLGPEGGDEGGRVVVTGTPAQVARHAASYTGLALRNYRAGPAQPSQRADHAPRPQGSRQVAAGRNFP